MSLPDQPPNVRVDDLRRLLDVTPSGTYTLDPDHWVPDASSVLMVHAKTDKAHALLERFAHKTSTLPVKIEEREGPWASEIEAVEVHSTILSSGLLREVLRFVDLSLGGTRTTRGTGYAFGIRTYATPGSSSPIEVESHSWRILLAPRADSPDYLDEVVP